MKLYVYIFLVPGVLAMGDSAATRRNHGLIGYGINPFDPPCAFACRDAIAGATLNCSSTMDMPGMEPMVMTDPECYATDDVFLQTLAWCVQSRCQDQPAWKLEKFWKDSVAGSFAVQPDPKVTYQSALAKVEATPEVKYAETGSLNKTSVVAEELWVAAYNTDVVFRHQESMQEGFG
jgi:hypothetical protein